NCPPVPRCCTGGGGRRFMPLKPLRPEGGRILKAKLKEDAPASGKGRAKPAAMPNTVPVACPKGCHTQPEPRSAYSTICKKCQAHFRIEEALRPVVKAQKAVIEQRQVRCFQCGAELEAPLAAKSTMCKR